MSEAVSASGGEFIDAEEAAARLGVKKATLYAYVSRGQLSRQRAVDGRHSLFDAREVDELAGGRRRSRRGELATAVESSITRVHVDHFGFRGHPIERLVDLPFGEVMSIIWDEPDPDHPADVPAAPARLRTKVRRLLPDDASNVDRMRIAVVAARSADPLRHDLNPASVAVIGRGLIDAMIDALPVRRAAGRDSSAPDHGMAHADALWGRLSEDVATEAKLAALNTALVVTADHGLATSTFAVRVAASVRADPYLALTAGLGALGGPLHGGASEQVCHLLDRARELGSVTLAVGEILQRGDLVPGFGHKIYKHGDPRFALLMDAVRVGWAEDPRLGIIDDLLAVVAGRTPVLPNIDIAIGSLIWLAGMRPGDGEAIFAVSRTVGWLAHAMEEYAAEPVRFRPQARYVGPVDLDS